MKTTYPTNRNSRWYACAAAALMLAVKLPDVGAGEAKKPNEWNNLIDNPNMATLINKHRQALPAKSHPILGHGSTGHKAFKATEAAGSW